VISSISSTEAFFSFQNIANFFNGAEKLTFSYFSGVTNGEYDANAVRVHLTSATKERLHFTLA